MINAVVFRWFSGAEVQKMLKNAFLAPKRVLEPQNHPFHLGKHKGWSTWVIVERIVLQKVTFSDFERFDRSGPPKTTVKQSPKRICENLIYFLDFSKKYKSHDCTFWESEYSSSYRPLMGLRTRLWVFLAHFGAIWHPPPPVLQNVQKPQFL